MENHWTREEAEENLKEIIEICWRGSKSNVKGVGEERAFLMGLSLGTVGLLRGFFTGEKSFVDQNFVHSIVEYSFTLDTPGFKEK